MTAETVVAEPLRNRSGLRRLLLAVGLVLLPVVAVGWYWFQPHKLLVDDRVDEPLPAGAAAEPSASAPSGNPAPSAPETLAVSPGSGAGAVGVTATTVEATTTAAGPVAAGRGEFRSLEHKTTGTAVVLALGDGNRLLRLEDLDTSNGPDLRVILSSAPLSDDWRVWGEDYVELDRLKGNVGSQNYDIPADLDLARYGRVVIWCDRFDVGFGVADIGV